jgi:DNA-binding winged helix-turn-helix (wHTH) protein
VPAVRFGIFEADLVTGELLRKGLRVSLQEQPFQVLAALLERPGELVTREELRSRIWPSAVFVDFEHGLNKAISKLRRALGDTAASPRFVETLPRRGYRFTAPVGGGPTPAPRLSPSATFRVLFDGRTMPMAEGETVLGRDPQAGLCIDAPSVSRHHARIVVAAGAAVLEDLGSKNGTFLNGRRLQGPAPLRDGDEIKVGAAVVVVRAGAALSTQTR